MSNRRKIKNNKTKNHQMNNDKLNKSMMDLLKNKNISTTLVTKFSINHSTMVVDFGNKKDMEDYINKVKKHQLPKEFFDGFFDRFFREPPKELSENLNEGISEVLTEEVFEEIANNLNEELTDELREEISKKLREKVLKDFREEVIEDFYEGIEIFKPYLENNKIGLIRIFQSTIIKKGNKQ